MRFDRSARASVIRWRWPPDSSLPCSPTSVFQPSGSSATQFSRPARRSADSSSASEASDRPMRTFSRMEVEKRWESWPATAIAPLTSSCLRSRRSRPPSVTRPCSGSRKRSTRFTTVVLPAPLSPTRAIRLPGSSRRLNPSRTRVLAPRIPGADVVELERERRSGQLPGLCWIDHERLAVHDFQDPSAGREGREQIARCR